MLRIKRKPNPDWDEIRQMFKQGAARQDRIAQLLDHAARQQAAHDLVWRVELAKQRRENEKAFKELWRVLNGTTKHTGLIAEEFFYSALRSEPPFYIQGIPFHEVSADRQFIFNDHQMQCDLLLANQNYVAPVEVKHFLKQGHVREFNRKLNKVVPIVLPIYYRHLAIMPVMACIGIHPKAEVAARECGMAPVAARWSEMPGGVWILAYPAAGW